MPIILFGLVAVIGIVTWLVAQEGVWGAASILLSVVLSGLIAMNFFEPLAAVMSNIVPRLGNYADFVCLVGLFAGSVAALRAAGEYLAPVDIRVPDMLDTIGKWGFAAVTGYLTMAFLLTALHTAPLPREFLGFRPEEGAFFGLAPDRQWLAFTQYVSERSLQRSVIRRDPISRMPMTNAASGRQLRQPNVFDGMIRDVGDPQAPHPNRVWASFPIRYAHRRSEIEKGNVVAGAVMNAAPRPVAPQGPTGGPSSPGGF
jgi:hypothetical protein